MQEKGDTVAKRRSSASVTLETHAADNSNMPSQREPVLAKWLVWCGMAVWFFAVGLALHFDASKPTRPDPTSGRIYELNNHSHVVYLTLREQLTLWAVMFGGLGTAFVGIGLGTKNQPARPVSMTRLNALNVGFLAFVGLFLVWAIFFFR